VASACAALGAGVSEYAPLSDAAGVLEVPTSGAATLDDAEGAADVALGAVLADRGSVDVLVIDGAGLFAAARAREPGSPEAARIALRVCLESVWNLTRAVANLAFLPRADGGRVIYLAPSHGAGEHVEAARAGLENLARTLSIEWARYAITAVTIAPGASTGASEVAAITAYLASPAGAYFSGALIDLRGPAAQRPGEPRDRALRDL
jgi:NAD(P)-dependent dehydrogenase (short-subunit alcohol dehydrogenase family)